MQSEILCSFRLLDRSDVMHFQSKRFGGFSDGDFSSLNTSFAVGDSYENVMRNRQIIADEIGIELSRFVFCRQTHADGIHYVEESDIGRGVDYHKHDIIHEVDALITDIPRVVLCVKVADCIPLFLYAPDRRVVAIAHIGWRGALSMLAIKTIDSMKRRYSVDCRSLLAVVGVGCGSCCYEVSSEIAESFAHHHTTIRDGKRYLDLKGIVEEQLSMCGLRDEQIEVSSTCSICHSDSFFSARAQQGKGGYGMAGIALL